MPDAPGKPPVVGDRVAVGGLGLEGIDEALSRAEKFLDEALLAEVQSVRLIHGYGTGQLRRAIAEFLHDHKFVAHFQSAPPEQGGGGVTVVEFKE